ncbi:MAG: FtsH protease activity modulator HflK [Oleibacter sp.]|nr:FtsH protease activity modulator HflK [Thalassolituus sp.]
MAWNEPGGKGNPKDPWGNNNNHDNNRGNKGGGNNQPPDLDEVIRKLTDKLNSLFGGGKGNRGGSSDNNQGGGAILIIALIVGAVFLGMNAVYTIDESERGVVLRTGKFERLELPGLQLKIPVIETVTIVNSTELRTIKVSETMLTKDNNIVDVMLDVQYTVPDPVSFALRLENPEATLISATESALRHEVGSMAMDAILTSGRVTLANELVIRLQNYLDSYESGISVRNVNVAESRPPAAVKDAFDDVERARQDKERFVNDAEAYANSVVPEARGRAQRQFEEASAYKEKVIARAQGEAERFTKLLTEYNKAPEVTRERLYIDAISAVYANTSKVLLDAEGGNNMMYLPLDKLVQPVQAAASKSGMSTSDISRLTDQVVNELRTRQTSTSVRREGR